MPDAVQQKQIISRAIARAFETHGHNVEGLVMPNPATAKVLTNAVCEALQRAKAFRD